MAFGKTYAPTSLGGRRYEDRRSDRERSEEDELLAKMEAEARNAPGIASGVGGAIGGGLGLAGGLIAAPFTGGASLTALPALMTGGAAIGSGLGGAWGQAQAGTAEAKADAIRQKRERELAEQEQRLLALGPLVAQLRQRRF